LAVLLALPAACQNQPQAAANAQPPARAVAAPPRNDLQVAEDSVRRQLGNGQDASFANQVAYRDDRIAIVCGEVVRGGRRERYIAVDGRGAWLESEMRPGEMDRAVREFCRAGAQRPQGRGPQEHAS
jgi:hypothetical protein